MLSKRTFRIAIRFRTPWTWYVHVKWSMIASLSEVEYDYDVIIIISHGNIVELYDMLFNDDL